MSQSYTLEVKRFEPTDPRLGRHVVHDSRSKNYPYKAAKLSTLSSIDHERYIPILDQGQIGSCTGNAGTGCMGSEPFWEMGQTYLSPTDATADETDAVDLYSDATKSDPYEGEYPPTDTGSDGLSVAKVLLARGDISGYEHTFTFEAFLTALAAQPVIVGTEWREDQFTPDSDGRLHITGAVAGGHEYLMRKLDVENRRVWMDQSWGSEWGVDGRAYFTYDDFEELLIGAQGDCTVFTPISVPAPTPIPTPDDPTVITLDVLKKKYHTFRQAMNNFLTQES
jgi:hypothetical protein